MLISFIQYKTLINKKIKTLYTLVLYRENTEVIVVQIKVKTKIAKSEKYYQKFKLERMKLNRTKYQI